ncbi:stage III sporulation protein AH [Pullulanibacillus camelliae]|uniref:Stage III sporulation protein AH n=1 Tax=Pullulanibacillus camelliae TaxID=1707096 RepID=A0A8J3DWC6_9BACL|nr:stage III sporulation protein AG [Pullulanibacillus camelliae]GGE46565.1 stage III sporulation protein AH [Pullulanibacillus camelliae]
MSLSKLLQLLKDLFLTEKTDNKKKKSPLQPLVILLIIGVALMVFSRVYSSQTASQGDAAKTKAVQTSGETASQDMETFKTDKKNTFSSFEDYAAYYEDHLTSILNEVSGVSNVHVMVVVDTTVQNVYGKNSDTQNNHTNEEDKDGGTRESNEQNKKEDVVIIDGGDTKEPLIITKKSPVVKGVWVVADGVDNPTIKSWIVDAVSSVLGIPSYKVSVTQGKSKEE